MRSKVFGVMLAALAIAVSGSGYAKDKLDPQEKPVLDQLKKMGAKPFHTLSPADARKGPTPKDAITAVLTQQGKPTTPEPVAKVVDQTIPGAAGTLPIRVYTPTGAGPFPVVVYFHGGGFVLADKDVYDASPRALANAAGAVVVSVDYRRAPENVFPAALDDATAAFNYVLAHAADFNGDPAHVAVAGESAGGNLATGVAMRQSKNMAPRPVFQLLVYPFVSGDLKTSSHRKNGKGNYLIGNDDLAWFWKNYLGADWKKNTNPEAMPLLATNEQLKLMPPALVITAGLDPLQDEGTQYAQKLTAAGVAVDVKNFDGVTHEFFGMGAVLDEAKQAQQAGGAALKLAFSKPGDSGAGAAAPAAK